MMYMFWLKTRFNVLPNLYKDPKIQKDLNIFRIKIKQIKDLNAQTEAFRLLKMIKEEIQIIEENHKSKILGEVRPNLYAIHREKIVEYRKTLVKLLKENGVK